ncbi:MULTISPECIES: nitronate monooxygenase family protein [unclassified Paraburkholderia]|uniref:NAD(P)H-dependent flavin oxidoreductase n=1 Tax=unclassified Paraburkholderia TaxID=2615204 RepID=UPI001607A1D2|nr:MULTISPECIES: nitronate monooxygenase [unclassified Paraburkholderia]
MLPSRLPLVQAPMVGSLSPLTIAVSEAGGLGSLACAALSPAQLREQIGLIRAGTSAPFNVNFFCHTSPDTDEEGEAKWLELLAPYYREIGLELSAARKGPGRAPFDEAMCDVIEETRPPVISFHFGLPREGMLARVRRTGAMIVSSATTVEEARWLESRGVDAIIAQGAEAGGHRGMFLTSDINAQPGLFALLPQIVDAVRVPVIAAGAIADGRGIAAAFALGASAVQIGTAYLMTPQAGRSGIHRAALRGSRDDTTRLTNLYTGRPARGLMTRFMHEQGPMSAVAPAFPLATGAVDPLRVAFEKSGCSDFSLLWAGEAAALAREEDAGLLTRQIWEEALKCASGLRL